MPIELSVAVISGATGLSVVFLTHFLSQQGNKKRFRAQYLSDALADLFQHYLRFCADPSNKNRSLLLTSIERCRLYCSEQFLAELDQFETALLYDRPNMEIVGKHFAKLRQLSRKEMHR